MAYDGVRKEADATKTTKEESLDLLSERMKRKLSLQEVRRQERPMPMRSELIDNYFNHVMKLQTDKGD